jgi:protein phosphatase 2C
MAGVGVRMSSDRKQDSVDKCHGNPRRLTSTFFCVAGASSGSCTRTGTEISDRPGQKKRARDDESITEAVLESSRSGKVGHVGIVPLPPISVVRPVVFGYVSVAGRLREMEDAVCVRSHFFRLPNGSYMHFFAVFDGHGGSHVIISNFFLLLISRIVFFNCAILFDSNLVFCGGS